MKAIYYNDSTLGRCNAYLLTKSTRLAPIRMTNYRIVENIGEVSNNMDIMHSFFIDETDIDMMRHCDVAEVESKYEIYPR